MESYDKSKSRFLNKNYKHFLIAFLYLANLYSSHASKKEASSNTDNKEGVTETPDHSIRVLNRGKQSTRKESEKELVTSSINNLVIPILFDSHKCLLILTVNIITNSVNEKQIIDSHIYELKDLLLTDLFDSCRILLYDAKTLSKANAEKLRKRIWILLHKKINSLTSGVHFVVTLSQIRFLVQDY